jgi:hypothetical protein
MPSQRIIRIIIDTNLWISFLIGKELKSLKDLIVSNRVRLIISNQLIQEIKIVTTRSKLKKYFKVEQVNELVTFLEIIADKVEPHEILPVCRDPKDDFILAIAKTGRADYIITGDKDLLEIGFYGKTIILNKTRFEELKL